MGTAVLDAIKHELDKKVCAYLFQNGFVDPNCNYDISYLYKDFCFEYSFFNIMTRELKVFSFKPDKTWDLNNYIERELLIDGDVTVSQVANDQFIFSINNVFN